jgi:hypothetical protein
VFLLCLLVKVPSLVHSPICFYWVVVWLILILFCLWAPHLHYVHALLSGACFLLSRSAVDVSKYVISSKSTDVITGLRAFFKESSAFDPSSRSALVLKCIQQEMIFPCVTTLRKEIYETLPYQDVRGTWKIIVLIGNTSLTVRHKKRERSRSVEDSEYFEFEWELDLKFNPELTAFTSSSYPCE